MKRVAIIGASGYTGAELVRLLATHGGMEIAALAADRKAGGEMADVFPHLAHLPLPRLVRAEEIDPAGLDLVFLALPHGVAHGLARGALRDVRIVDLSADFRLRDPGEYERWYGAPHAAPALQEEAVFGLPEFYREAIREARIVANTGCYVATALLALLPLVEAGVIDPDDIVIDAASGVSGAGRALKESSLFAEASEGMSAYGVGGHRHVAEIEQEISRAAGRRVVCAFTPHLLPQVRGILATIYVRGDPADVHGALVERYRSEPFVHVPPFGRTPATRHVRGSNLCHVGVAKDRRPGRAILVAALDNMVKGASGQALQCANLMLGLPETQGLGAAPLFP